MPGSSSRSNSMDKSRPSSKSSNSTRSTENPESKSKPLKSKPNTVNTDHMSSSSSKHGKSKQNVSKRNCTLTADTVTESCISLKQCAQQTSKSGIAIAAASNNNGEDRKLHIDSQINKGGRKSAPVLKEPPRGYPRPKPELVKRNRIAIRKLAGAANLQNDAHSSGVDDENNPAVVKRKGPTTSKLGSSQPAVDTKEKAATAPSIPAARTEREVDCQTDTKEDVCTDSCGKDASCNTDLPQNPFNMDAFRNPGVNNDMPQMRPIGFAFGHPPPPPLTFPCPNPFFAPPMPMGPMLNNSLQGQYLGGAMLTNTVPLKMNSVLNASFKLPGMNFANGNDGFKMSVANVELSNSSGGGISRIRSNPNNTAFPNPFYKLGTNFMPELRQFQANKALAAPSKFGYDFMHGMGMRNSYGSAFPPLGNPMRGFIPQMQPSFQNPTWFQDWERTGSSSYGPREDAKRGISRPEDIETQATRILANSVPEIYESSNIPMIGPTEEALKSST